MKVKAILCNASTKTVEEVLLSKENMLEDIYKNLGEDVSMFEVAGRTKEYYDDICCDEEGLLKEVKTVCVYQDLMAPIMGNLLITGVDEDGGTVDCKTPIEVVRAKVKMYTIEEAKAVMPRLNQFIEQFQ